MTPIQIVRASKDGISKVEQTPYLCEIAVRTHGSAIKYVENQTEELKWLAIRRLPQSLKHVKNPTKEMCLEAIKINWTAILYVTDPTDEMIEAAVESDSAVLEFVKQTPELCDKALERDPFALSSIKSEFLTDEMLEEYLPIAPVIIPDRFNQHFYDIAVKADPSLILKVPKEFVTEKMCLRYVKSFNLIQYHTSNKYVFPDMTDDSCPLFISDIVDECIPEEFRSSELLYEAAKHGYLFSENLTDDLIKTALAKNGWSIRKVPNPTDEMIELALSNTSLAIAEIKDQRDEWCWLSINKNPDALNFIRNPTNEMVAFCLKKSGYLIGILDEKEITDEMKHIAIESHPDSIAMIRQTEELVWKAIKLDPSSICHIKNPTIEMYRYVIDVDPEVLVELEHPLKNLSEEEIIEIYKNILSHSPYLIEKLKIQTEELCLWLVERHPKALKYIYEQTYDIVKVAMSKADVSKYIYDPDLKSAFGIKLIN